MLTTFPKWKYADTFFWLWSVRPRTTRAKARLIVYGTSPGTASHLHSRPAFTNSSNTACTYALTTREYIYNAGASTFSQRGALCPAPSQTHFRNSYSPITFAERTQFRSRRDRSQEELEDNATRRRGMAWLKEFSKQRVADSERLVRW